MQAMYTLYISDVKEPLPVVTIDTVKKSVQLISPTLLQIMSTSGITITPLERERFNGKARVLVGDPEFYEAFTKIYVPANYPVGRPGFEWRTWTRQ